MDSGLFIVVAVVVLLALGIGQLLVRRWFLRPLEVMATTAEEIAAGHTELRVPQNGPAEVVSVARAFNELTEELLRNQQRLADNVKSLDETNQRLVETQRDLVQAEKLASLGQLAAGVAHEIGNPLGAVMGYVSLQKRRGGDTEIVDGLERETRRIDRIVRELLDYARPASDNRIPVNVGESIERVVGLLRDQGWLDRVDLKLDLAPELPKILGDPHRIDQVFVNLLRNAEGAMDGTGSLTVSAADEVYLPGRPIPVRRADDPPGVNYSHLRRGGPTPIVSGLEPGRRVVHIEVTDTGPGISEEEMVSIFDPFFTTKGPGKGTGLGLAIVAGTIAELGGRIEASSVPGEGATFSIWLPAIEN